MAFQPIGDYSGRFKRPPYLDARNIRGGIITAQEVVLAGGTKGVIRSQNYDGSSTGWAIFGDGSASFYGDITVGADLYSSNWTGTTPANLASFDTGATSGYYLDHSAGAAQFMGDVWIGPEGQLTVYSSADNNSYVEIGEQSGGLGFLIFKDDDLSPALNPLIHATMSSAAQTLGLYSGALAGEGSGDLSAISIARANLSSETGILVSSFKGKVGITAGGIVGLTSNGNTTVIVSDTEMTVDGDIVQDTGGSLYTDYSLESLPRVWYVDCGSHTLTSASTYESDATTFSKNLGTARPLTANILMICYANNTSSATRREGRIRVRWSTDGGSTWTNGPITRFVGLGTSNVSRGPLSAMGAIDNVTPTGNVVVEAQLWGDHTEVTFTNIQLQVFAVGDA